jgi:tRNA(fMet)-specific endonuclease VapC
MGTLIDTSIFVEAERGKFDLGAWLSARSDELFAISAITASELLHGVHRAPAGRRREARRAFVDSVLTTYPIHPFDAEAAVVHAEKWAAMQAKGQPIGAHDLLIAATALLHDYAVATFNEADFSRVPGLKVILP